jgi:hypothetical protein
MLNRGVIIMLDQMMKMLEGQQINSYRLNKLIGAGGFGGVFHASEISFSQYGDALFSDGIGTG